MTGLLARPRPAGNLPRARTGTCCADDVGLLDDPDWPILTQHAQRAPARLLDGAAVVRQPGRPGCSVAGTVGRSVLGPGVVVEAGAVGTACLADTTIGAGARVSWSIVDSGCASCPTGREVGDASAALEDPDAIAIVGRECRVSTACSKPGARLALRAPRPRAPSQPWPLASCHAR